MQDILDYQFFDKGKDSFSNVRHSHGKSYEIIFALSGDGVFLVDDNIFEIKQNHLYLIDGMSTHCSSPQSPEEYSRRKIIINGNMLEETLKMLGASDLIEKLFANGGRCIVPSPEVVGSINDAFFEIDRAISENSDFNEMRVKLAVIKILLIANDSEYETAASDSENISAILKYLGDHFRSRLTLEDISEATHISKYYICHSFKKHLSMTVFEYILAKRISYAKKLLVYSDLSISRISIESGFSDFAYFSKVFKKSEGLRPKDYRMNNQ